MCMTLKCQHWMCATVWDTHACRYEKILHNKLNLSFIFFSLLTLNSLSWPWTWPSSVSECEIQHWFLLNWRKIQFRCGCVVVLVNCNFFDIIPCFAIFKNVVHSLEPGETRSNSRSASHQASNYVQRSYISQNTLIRFVAVHLCLFFQFS